MILPTVKVLRDGGRGVRIINASDYNPALHTLADDRADQPATQPAPVAPVKKGKRK